MAPHTRTVNPSSSDNDLQLHQFIQTFCVLGTPVVPPPGTSPLSGVDLQILAQLLDQDSIKQITISVSDLDKTPESLDRCKNNWPRWSMEMQDIIYLNHGGGYLTGSITRPDEALDPTCAAIWDANHLCIVAALCRKCTLEEQGFLRAYTNAKAAWDALRARHEEIGPLGQILLIQKLLAVRYRRSECLSTTSRQISEDVARLYSARGPTEDIFVLAIVFNALSEEFPAARNRIVEGIPLSTDGGSCTSAHARARLDSIEQLIGEYILNLPLYTNR